MQAVSVRSSTPTGTKMAIHSQLGGELDSEAGAATEDGRLSYGRRGSTTQIPRVLDVSNV